jgi:hypothetical protein
MDTKIIWPNYKIYDHATIVERMIFVKKNMNGLLPIYGKEKEKLQIYANEHHLPPYEMVCLRNTIRIQKEIDSSKKFGSSIGKIRAMFRELTNELATMIDDNQKNLKIRYFFKSTQMPFHYVYKTIVAMPEFKSLTENSVNYIKKLDNAVYAAEIEIHDRSLKFEHMLENYLKSLNIKFRTEEDIKRDKDYNVTPDILFDGPIILELNGINYNIRWMDAKNYILTNTPFIIKSLHKQAAKYNNAFGMGAFVFHYGFDSSIEIPGTLILDGSWLDKFNKFYGVKL